MITNSYLQKKKYPSVSERPKSLSKYSSFSDSPSLHDSTSKFKLNISKNSEPLNSISRDLSFKGSPFNGGGDAPKEIFTIAKALEKFTAEFGKSAADHLEATINSVTKDHHITGISKDANGGLKFASESTGKKIKDILLYPILKLPVDFVMGTLQLIKKIPGLKNSKFIDDILKKDVFKNRKNEIRLTSEAASIKGFFEKVSQDKDFKAFKDAHGRLKPLVSNYSTTIERSVTRFVTGMIPAVFLANDAYNLSMYMKNNKHVAEEEKKRRFNQEAARIGITTAMTFGVLSMFAKKSNGSEGMTNMLMSGVVFVSEFLGRMAAGNPVLPVGHDAAQKYAAKRQKHIEEKKSDKKGTDAFKGNEGKEKTYSAPPEKGALTFANAMKVIGGLIVFGFAMDKAKDIDFIKKPLKSFSEKYDSYFKKDFEIETEVFQKHLDNLTANGFESIAESYKKIVKDQLDKNPKKLKIGQSTKKLENTLINQFALFPVKFVWNSIVMLPWKVSKNAVKGIWNSFKSDAVKAAEKARIQAAKTPEQIEKEAAKEAKVKQDKNLAMLKDSLGFLNKLDPENKTEYQRKLNQHLLSGLDNVTKSNYSNAELGATVRTTSNAVTSAFLIADSWNMVMIDSQGQNKGLAEQKAKERTVQRGIRIVYGAFIQQLFNGLFKKTYDSSLIGAQAVNTFNTCLTEVMERKSVGLPLGESTRDQILQTERENLQADGIKGSYYRTMAKLTGKKALSASASKKEKKA